MEIMQERFNRIAYLNKLINYYDDVAQFAFKSDGFIKNFITTRSMRGEEKGKQAFDYKHTCKAIFTTNEIPTPTTQASIGFYDRWVIVPLLQRFRGNKNQDVNLIEKLKEECEGIIFYISLFLPYLNERLLIDSNETKELWTKYGSSVTQFYNTLNHAPDIYTQTQELYQLYKSYCETENLNIVSMIVFGKQLGRLGVTVTQRNCSNGRQWVYMGVKI
jgi:phage/plasmid-associated DNA primase